MDDHTIKELRRLTTHQAQRSCDFYAWFLRTLEDQLTSNDLVTSQLNRNDQIHIQTIYLHVFEHYAALSEKYNLESGGNSKKDLFSQEILEIATQDYHKQSQRDHYGIVNKATVPNHLLDACSQVYNLLASCSKDLDTQKYITCLQGAYFFQGDQLPLRPDALYYQLFDLVFHHFQGKEGSITFDELVALGKDSISKLHTTKGRSRSDINRLIRNNLATNNTGLRRASRYETEMRKILFAPAKQDIIIFKNTLR